MVTITKPPKRSNAILFKKTLALVSLLVLLWIGHHWLSFFHSYFISFASEKGWGGGGGSQSLRIQQQQQQQQQRPLPKNEGIAQPKPKNGNGKGQEQQHQLPLYQQKSESILSRLDQLSRSVPLSTPKKKKSSADDDDGDGDGDSDMDAIESKFLSAARKECIPGRDDATDEINPTTHRKRECLRHVPLGRRPGRHKIEDGLDLEERMNAQRPRIGILAPPGFVSEGFARWIGDAVGSTGNDILMDVEVIHTSRVPVYGYGKSHGFTKLIRLVTLPLSLASYDAYLKASSMIVEGKNEHNKDEKLRDVLDEMKLGRKLSPPSADSIGRILQLVLRWHCRVSHVSAHTAMITVSLDDVIKDPVDVLSNVLSFVWREDWEWEGHGGKHRQGSPREGGWGREARDFARKDDTGAKILQTLVECTALVVDEAISSSVLVGDDADGNTNTAFVKSIQGAFASEMRRSKDMTSWPCPSFWEGVDGGAIHRAGDVGGVDHRRQEEVLRQISGEMVPNCSDDDPFVRCTVNRDRCEVRRDAKCKQ